MRGYLKSSIDIKDFNKELVRIAKRAKQNGAYTEEELEEIDRKTDLLYKHLMNKRKNKSNNLNSIDKENKDE